MPSDAEVISTLNGLIETCRDGREGFRTAAEGVRSAELRELFHTYARQRASFAGELQDEVRRLGGDPERTGSLVATLHRGWMGLRAALETYRAALDTDLHANVRAMVERQFAEVKEAHNLISNLERRSGAGA